MRWDVGREQFYGAGGATAVNEVVTLMSPSIGILGPVTGDARACGLELALAKFGRHAEELV